MPGDPPLYPCYYRAMRPCPALGLWAGDTIRYDPRGTPEIVLVRRLPPNHGGLLLAIEDGVLTPLSDDADVRPLVPAGRSASPPGNTPRPGRPASDPIALHRSGAA